MKKLITISLVLLFAGAAAAQWDFVSNFPDDLYMLSNAGHGIAVDPDGKIWHTMYGAFPEDTLLCSDGVWRALRKISVFNPDGTPADISPIFFAKGGAIDDTLGIFWNDQADPPALEARSSRGMKADHEGNILQCAWNAVYRLNYVTGEAMTKMVPPEYTAGIAPGVAMNTGTVFTGPVLPDFPYVEWAADGTMLGNAIDAADVTSYARTMAAGPDGNTLYVPRYTTDNVYIWTRPDEFSAFALTDSIVGVACESMVWHPVTGDLWISAGSYNDLPNDGHNLTNYSPGTHYAFNITTAAGKAAVTVTDSIKWQFNTPENAGERHRGIGFGPDGNTAYVTCFGGADYPAIQKFQKSGTGVWEPAGIIDGFTLSPNYPNPFNPTTTIRYSVGRAGMTTIKVFDLMGREVATLVNEHLDIGNYTTEFDGSNLPSGTYVYVLRSGSRVLSQRMTLSK